MHHRKVRQQSVQSRPQASAFSLVEVVIALGLVSFALVAILGLFSLGLNGVRDSDAKVNAANVAEEIVGKRLASPTIDFTTTFPDFPVPAIADLNALPTTPPLPSSGIFIRADGTRAPSPDAAAFKLTYRLWQLELPSATGANRLVRMHVIVSWPPLSSKTENFAEFLGSTLIAP